MVLPQGESQLNTDPSSPADTEQTQTLNNLIAAANQVVPVDPTGSNESPLSEESDVKEETVETPEPVEKTSGSKKHKIFGGVVPKDVAHGSPYHLPNYFAAAGHGLLDSTIDLLNLIPKKNNPNFPNPFHDKNDKIKKFSKFEAEGLQATREIAGLVIPYIMLKGTLTTGAKGLHATGKAPLWLRSLGNNKAFARFATVGLDLGAGAATDAYVETNKFNDTLATSWKRGKWWGHNIVPESWTSDNLGQDGKMRANVLEGMRLGFYTDVALGFARLARASFGLKRVSKYISLTGDQKNLNSYVKNDLDLKIFDEDNPVADNLARSEAKYLAEKEKLKEFWESQEIKPDTPTVGLDQIPDEAAGIITKNSNILELAEDQARIANNKGTTYGRLGNILTDAYRLASTLPENVRKRTLLNSLRENLLKGGKYDVEFWNGKKLEKLPWKIIDQESKILAEIVADPTLPRGDLIKILDQFKEIQHKLKILNPVGYKGISKAMNKYLKNWGDINTHKARGLFLTSEAGSISDLGEAGRHLGRNEGLERLNEQMLDRLELFDIESSIADFEWKGAKSAFNNLKDAVTSKDNSKVIRQLESTNREWDQKLSEIIPNAKEFRRNLYELQTNNPEFANALRLAYEMSDGNVQSIKGMNRTIKNLLGTASKAFIDGDPEIQSLVNRALMTNIFNSMLSAIGTPMRALTGNFGGMISEPISVMYGALREGDNLQMRRAQHMYFGLTDTLQQGFSYMGKVFRKASQSSEEIGHLYRNDLAVQKAKGVEFAEEFATAASRNGEDGPQTILNLYKELDAISQHPALRWGPNALTALDGFTEAIQKVALDKGQAFDILLERFPDGNWSKTDFQKVFKDLHAKGWDENGMISQSAVEWSRREVALNLDTPLVKNLNPIIKRIPILRSIFWFPTTQMNVLEMMGKYSPRIGVQNSSIGFNFANDFAELLGPYGNKKVTDFTPQEIQKILAKRGMDMSGDPIAKFEHLRNKTRGRVAIGNTAVMAAGLLAMQGRIRGNGHWDPAVQKTRIGRGWKKLTFKPWGSDKWVSYEFLGPLAKWVGLVVDGFDNFDSMSTTRLEQFDKKMGFILGAAFTDDSLLGSAEPLFNILSGNSAARNRWIAQTTNNIFPLGGMRNELGKNLFGMLRDVENDDIGEIIRNRNNWLDVFDRDGALPGLTDYVTGEKIKVAEGNLLSRIWNTSGPGPKVSSSPSELGQFLIDLEFDSEPTFATSRKGVPLTTNEIQELANLIGQDRRFNKALIKIKRRAENLTYKTPEGKIIKGYVNIMRYARREGLTGDQFNDYQNIKFEIKRQLYIAKNELELQLSTKDDIRKRYEDKYIMKKQAEKGNIERVLELANPQPSN